MKYKAVICDLDGTLLNTLDDLMDSVNYGLKCYDMPPITLQQTRRFVGNGVAKLVERAVVPGTTKEIEGKVLEKFREYYSSHSMDKTKPYDGVIDMLKKLKDEGYKTAIVSNKIQSAVSELSKIVFGDLIDVAIGETPDVPKKPAPDMIYKALKELNISKEEAIFMGDSDVDVATGLNSGLDMITVLWGFRDREELEQAGAKIFAESTEDIFKYL